MPLMLSTLIPGVATTKTVKLTLWLSAPHVLPARADAASFAGYTGHRCYQEELRRRQPHPYALVLSFSEKLTGGHRIYELNE